MFFSFALKWANARTSAFKALHGDQFTLSTQWIEPNYVKSLLLVFGFIYYYNYYYILLIIIYYLFIYSKAITDLLMKKNLSSTVHYRSAFLPCFSIVGISFSTVLDVFVRVMGYVDRFFYLACNHVDHDQ